MCDWTLEPHRRWQASDIESMTGPCTRTPVCIFTDNKIRRLHFSRSIKLHLNG